LAAAGKHEAVVERVAHARYQPKRKAARAYAKSLVALGRVDQARAALQNDFRHGGDIHSLKALADLERVRGLDGIAAAHYARIYSLEPRVITGDAAVCDLFRARARAFVDLGEGLAAHSDMRRVAVLCGEPGRQSDRLADADLWARIEDIGSRQVRAQRLLPKPAEDPVSMPGANERRPIRAQLGETLAAGRQVSPKRLVEVLAAELAGKLGPTLLSDGQLRVLAGEQDWVTLAPAVDALSAAPRAYAKLRLSAIRSEPLENEAADKTRQRWIAEVIGVPGANPPRGGWRALVVAGDLSGAELSLSTQLRGHLPAPAPEQPSDAKKKKVEPEPPAVPKQTPLFGPPEHWSAKVPVTVQTLPDLLALGRLLTARGQQRRGLRVSSYALAQARAASLPIEPLAREEVAFALESARPWDALILAAAHGGSLYDDVRPVVGTAIQLLTAACDDACGEREQRRDAEIVMGEDWVRAQLPALVVADRVHVQAPTRPGCPGLEESLAPDASGPLANALKEAARDPRAIELPAMYERALESDLGFVCAAPDVIPLMAASGHRVTAAKLAERLAHVPEFDAAGQFETYAAIALVADDQPKAMMMIIAAAGISSDPAAVWARAARLGRALGHREYELHALRESALLEAGPPNVAQLRAMTLVQLSDVAAAFHARNSPIESEAIARAFASYLATHPDRRYAELDSVARALAVEPWGDDTAFAVLDEILWPDEGTRRRHATRRTSLARAMGQKLPLPNAGPLDFEAAAVALAHGEKPSDIEGLVLARAGAGAEARVRRALVEPDPTHKRRLLVAAAVSGTWDQRARAVQMLLSDLGASDESRRATFQDALLSGAVSAGPNVDPEPMFPDPDLLRVVLFSLDLKLAGLPR
jgi:hypothetical protein